MLVYIVVLLVVVGLFYLEDLWFLLFFFLLYLGYYMLFCYKMFVDRIYFFYRRNSLVGSICFLFSFDYRYIFVVCLCCCSFCVYKGMGNIGDFLVVLVDIYF